MAAKPNLLWKQNSQKYTHAHTQILRNLVNLIAEPSRSTYKFHFFFSAHATHTHTHASVRCIHTTNVYLYVRLYSFSSWLWFLVCVQFKKQAKEATKGNHWEVVKPLVASLWWSSNINNAIQYWIVVNVEHDDPFSVEPHEKPKDLCWPCSWFIYGEKNTNRKNSETSRRKQKKTKTHSSILWNDHPLCFIRFGRSAVESSIFFLWKQFSYVRINKFLNIWHWNVKISFQWIVMHILQYYFWSLYIFNDTRYLIRTSFFLLIFWEISSVITLN